MVAAGAVAALVATLLLAAAPAPAQPPPDASARARRRRRSCRSAASAAASVPRPFAGLLRWIGDRLQPVVDFFDGLAARIPGGRAGRSTRSSALLVLLARRRCWRACRSGAARPPPCRAARARAPRREDPAALEREADRAAAAGEWETAVRLRFRAGLLRLDAREVIEYRPSLTTGEVSDGVGSPAFDAHRRGLRRDRLRRPAARRRRTKRRAARAGSAC